MKEEWNEEHWIAENRDGAGVRRGCLYGWGAGDSKAAYLDTTLPAELCAADLVGRLTLEEKATQLMNQARPNPRLNVPEYDWWSEALHGVINSGTTEFPESVGLAATFDPPAIHKMAEVIGTEGCIKHARAVRNHLNDFFSGLDFWAPNINIFRDPCWGRGQKTYGEDPFLTARISLVRRQCSAGDSTASRFDLGWGDLAHPIDTLPEGLLS
jgi:beta-glucosidase